MLPPRLSVKGPAIKPTTTARVPKRPFEPFWCDGCTDASPVVVKAARVVLFLRQLYGCRALMVGHRDGRRIDRGVAAVIVEIWRSPGRVRALPFSVLPPPLFGPLRVLLFGNDDALDLLARPAYAACGAGSPRPAEWVAAREDPGAPGFKNIGLESKEDEADCAGRADEEAG
jgi:hypothetical protein